jgi:Dullard-like phosphatase family protein
MSLRSSRSLVLQLSSHRRASATVVPVLVTRRQQHVSRLFSSIAAPALLRPNLANGPRQKRLDATTVCPPEERNYESDLVVVLDMDECLIHSQFVSEKTARYAHQTNDDFIINEHVVDSFEVILPDGDLVMVNQRPYLHEFLHQVSEKFETHVFTAAMEVYAKPVLDTLDPTRTKFTKRWYRDSCVQTKDGAFVKNLGVLQKNEARIVLVDNNPLSFLANPSNGILVSSFYNDASDKTLLAVLQLLEELDAHSDVRPHLDKKFGLKSALDEVAKQGLA